MEQAIDLRLIDSANLHDLNAVLDILGTFCDIAQNAALKEDFVALRANCLQNQKALHDARRKLAQLQNEPAQSPLEREIIKAEEEIELLQNRAALLDNRLQTTPPCNETVDIDAKLRQLARLQDDEERLRCQIEQREEDLKAQQELISERRKERLDGYDVADLQKAFAQCRDVSSTVFKPEVIARVRDLIGQRISAMNAQLLGSTGALADAQAQILAHLDPLTGDVVRFLLNGPKPFEELKAFVCQKFQLDSKDALKALYSLVGKQLLTINRQSSNDLTSLQ